MYVKHVDTTLADRLLKGSAAIDKMKAETNHVVRTILGLIQNPKNFLERNGSDYNIVQSSDCDWYMMRRHGKLEVRCEKWSAGDAHKSGKIAFSTDETWDEYSGTNVSMERMGAGGIIYAREHLSLFVHGMISICDLSYLNNALLPFFDAASH